MAVYSSSEILTNTPIAVHGERKGVQMARATVVCAAAPATTDTLNFFYLPPGARVVGGYLSATDMDTNGSPTLTLNVGEAGTPARLFSASTVGQAGTASQSFAAGALDYQYAAKTLVTGVAQANAATGAAGSVTLALLYVVEE